MGGLAANKEALRNIVGILTNERHLDDGGKLGRTEEDGAVSLFIVCLRCENLGNGLDDVRDELAIGVVEDVILLAREREVGHGSADGLGDLGDAEVGLLISHLHHDAGGRTLMAGGHIAPVEAGFHFLGSGGTALQLEILFYQSAGNHCGGTGAVRGWGTGE